jgi:hypothetical protein
MPSNLFINAILTGEKEVESSILPERVEVYDPVEDLNEA